MDFKLANVYDVNKIALNGSSDTMLWTYHQKFLQSLQKLMINTGIYNKQLHFQNFMRTINNLMACRNWPAGRIFGTPGVTDRSKSIYTSLRQLRVETSKLKGRTYLAYAAMFKPI